MKDFYVLLLVVVLLAVSVNSSAAADNSTANATICIGNSTAIEAQGVM